MVSHPLPHYLRTYRRRSALTQRQVAWLLGCQAGSKVSRYERFARTPSLPTVIAYELILGTPARELFRGTYEAVILVIARRVRDLLRGLRKQQTSRLLVSQIAALEVILSNISNTNEP